VLGVDYHTANATPLQVSAKLSRILGIWDAGNGVYVFRFSCGISKEQAHVQEAGLIDYINSIGIVYALHIADNN